MAGTAPGESGRPLHAAIPHFATATASPGGAGNQAAVANAGGIPAGPFSHGDGGGRIRHDRGHVDGGGRAGTTGGTHRGRARRKEPTAAGRNGRGGTGRRYANTRYGERVRNRNSHGWRLRNAGRVSAAAVGRDSEVGSHGGIWRQEIHGAGDGEESHRQG